MGYNSKWLHYTSDPLSGFPPGAYYIVLENLGASTATGVVKVRWEERDEENDG